MRVRNYILVLVTAAACLFLMAIDNGPSETEAARAVASDANRAASDARAQARAEYLAQVAQAHSNMKGDK